MRMLVQLDPSAPTNALSELLGCGVEAARDQGGAWWIRTPDASEHLEATLRKLPGQLFVESADGRLVRPGRLVASGRLERALDWQQLEDAFSMELPTAWLSGKRSAESAITIRLERGGNPVAPSAALIDRQTLARWIDGASEVRLRRLRWVVCQSDAIVLGKPLPPVEARYFVENDRVLTPAGWHWSPPVSPDLLRTLLCVEDRQWVVWLDTNSWSVVDDDAFVALRRASVRQWCASAQEPGKETAS